MINTLLLSSRLPFLILTPAVLGLGIGSAYLYQPALSMGLIVLILLAGLSAHISVNLLNEYSDFHTGLDFNTQPTPFSGGSGGLINNPQAVNVVGVAGVLTLLLTVAIGLYFVWLRGATLLWVGLPGVLLIVTYTRWLNRSPWLCLIAPGLAFGPLMMVGTELVLTGQLSLVTVWLSLVPFFLVNNLLLVNQYPDIDADRLVGRRHFPIAYGLAASNGLYAGQFLLALLCLLLTPMLFSLSYGVWLGLLALLPALLTATSLWRYGNEIPRLIPFMGVNVAACVLTPILMTMGLVLF